MKKIIKIANEYTSQMNLVDISLLKLCLASMGVILGIATPKKYKKKVAAGASVLFAFTYAPLMTKFLGLALKDSPKA